MTMKLIPTYRFDKHGYYMGETRSMQDSETGLITMPRDCVSFPPGDERLHWRISKDKTCWQRVKGVEELEIDELVAYCSDETERNAMVRSRILNEAAKNPHYQVLKDAERDVLYVVKRPNDAKIVALQALKKQFLETCDRLVFKTVELDYSDAEAVVGERDELIEAFGALNKITGVDDIISFVNTYKSPRITEDGCSIIDHAIEARSMALLIERDAAWKTNGVQEFVEGNDRYMQALNHPKE